MDIPPLVVVYIGLFSNMELFTQEVFLLGKLHFGASTIAVLDTRHMASEKSRHGITVFYFWSQTICHGVEARIPGRNLVFHCVLIRIFCYWLVIMMHPFRFRYLSVPLLLKKAHWTVLILPNIWLSKKIFGFVKMMYYFLFRYLTVPMLLKEAIGRSIFLQISGLIISRQRLDLLSFVFDRNICLTFWQCRADFDETQDGYVKVTWRSDTWDRKVPFVVL